MDLSFKNQAIKNFFEERDDTYIPTAELMYIHTHPLVNPNFVLEIDLSLLSILEEMASGKVPEKAISRLTDLVIKLGKLMPEVTENNCEDILFTLREIYWEVKNIKIFFEGLK